MHKSRRPFMPNMDTYMIDLPSSPELRWYYTSMGYILVTTAEQRREMHDQMAEIEARIEREEQGRH